MIYQRAIDEGFTSALRDSAAVRYQRSCREPLLAAAAAVLSAKNHDDAAADYAQAALRLSPADPVLLTVAGSAAFLSGNPKSARFRFESAVKSMPNYQPALFDLGQVNIMYASTSTGEENIVSATNADAAVTSAFAGKNAEYFADSWPRNRLLIPAELPVSYFWQQYAFREGGWNDDGGEWNHLMPGVPPKPALFFLLLCFGLVIGIAAYNARRRQVQTVFYCSICGTAMCKKCRTGSLCASCISAVESANTEPGQQEVKIAIRVRQRRLFHVVSGLLDLLFPGSGGLYRKPSPDIGSIIALIATSMLYSVLITVWSIPSVNTSESMNPIYLLISIPVIIYWLVSAAFAAGRIANAANARFV